jgi:uncharacterized protein (DUF433 family)
MQIEIPDEIAAAAAEIASKTGQDVNALVAEMVTEAIKLRHVPTIHFEDGATGRRACVPGTGIPIWEIIELYEGAGRDRDELGRVYAWLDSYQLDAAIAYYEAFPGDITPRLKSDEEALAELHALWENHPQTSPHWPGRQRRVERPTGGASRESA